MTVAGIITRPRAMTGDRPTGPLHLGHLAGSLGSRVRLQDTCDQFVMVADLQALTDNAGNPAKVGASIPEVVADYIAVGLAPERTTIFLQSSVPELSELTMLYLNLVTVSRLERNPTIRNEIALRNFERSVPAGFLCYPVSQAADITAFDAEIVPVGDDQLPMIELAAEIVRRINHVAGDDILVEPRASLSNVPRLPGIDGKAKASKSLGNAIMINDEPDVVRRKVRMMYTDPNRLRATDPGTVEGNVVFSYLDAFDPNVDEVEDLKRRYRAGGIGDTALKARLADLLVSMLEPMQERRRSVSRDMALEILAEGTRRARAVASATLRRVRSALGVVELP